MDSILQTAANAPHTQDLAPGDVLLFVRPTLRQAWRYGWAGITAWLSGVITMLAQRVLCGAPQGHYDGFQDYSHVGIVVSWQGTLCALEAVPTGVRLMHLGFRLSKAHWPVHSMHLSSEYAAMFDDAHVAQFIERHSGDRYRWGGLPFAVLNHALGNDAPGYQFCSELFMRLLQYLGIVPGALPVVRHGAVVEGRLRPQAYAPCEVAQLPQYQRSGLYVIHKGV